MQLSLGSCVASAPGSWLLSTSLSLSDLDPVSVPVRAASGFKVCLWSGYKKNQLIFSRKKIPGD